jgi:hypothetical protein
MTIHIERNQNLLDIGIMTNGKLDNFFEDVMVRYGFETVTEDYTNTIIENPVFDTKNSFVNNFLLNNRKVVTSENFVIAPIGGGFSDGFSDGFDIE